MCEWCECNVCVCEWMCVNECNVWCECEVNSNEELVKVCIVLMWIIMMNECVCRCSWDVKMMKCVMSAMC